MPFIKFIVLFAYGGVFSESMPYNRIGNFGLLLKQRKEDFSTKLKE